MTDKQTQANQDTEQDQEYLIDGELGQTQEQKDDEHPADEETEQSIADYEAKIAQLDEKLEEYRDNHVENMKHEEMKAAHYNDGQIERYLSHVQGDNAEEIKKSVFKLSQDIPPVSPYGDPSLMNGAKVKPATVGEDQLMDIGRKAFQRVKHRIRGLGGR